MDGATGEITEINELLSVYEPYLEENEVAEALQEVNERHRVGIILFEVENPQLDPKFPQSVPSQDRQET